jgi:hypothetical protein
VVKLHMFASSSALFSCPLAMTDGATSVIRNMLTSNKDINGDTRDTLKKAYSHLTSNNPEWFWTSG